MRLGLFGIPTLVFASCSLVAQTSQTTQSTAFSTAAAVPNLIRFSGVVTPAASPAATRHRVDLTLALYSEKIGGTPLWTEQQTVALDATGHYSVFLGAGSAAGLPMEAFVSGDARWLSITAEGGTEEPRILLVSVPYALKAGDAGTLAGHPATDFVTPQSLRTEVHAEIEAAPQPAISRAALSGTGAPNYLPIWTSTTALGNSGIYQSGAHLGIGTTAPGSPLEISASVAGQATLLKLQNRTGFLNSTADMDFSDTSSNATFARLSTIRTNAHTAGDTDMAFDVYASSALTERMRIQSTGNVGIGVTAPASRLSVAGVVQSTTGGFKFPDNTVQATAAVSGLAAVSHDGTLTGSGTAASPLVVTSPFSPSDLEVSNNADLGRALIAEDYSNDGIGVWGESFDQPNNTGYGVYAIGNTGIYAQGNLYAGNFFGDVNVNGTLSKTAGSFKIDHPLDPANKYLSHSFVESPDMMNIYNGNIVTDAEGAATVTMPDWFEALNRDFRYQLTAIGQPAQAWIATEISNRQFTIRTDKANVKVSWQVTGIRHDAYANAHRIPVEEVKPLKERGTYLHPELFGQPKDKTVNWEEHQRVMRKPAQK